MGAATIGATMMGEKVKDTWTPSSHGSTFGGNPVCCAAAYAVMSRIDDALLQSVRQKSDYIRKTLTGAKGVKSVDGLGLMLGIACDRNAKEVVNACLQRGVLVLTAKDKVRLLPALNIPMEQLQKALEILKEELAK